MRTARQLLVGVIIVALLLSGCSGPKPEQTVVKFLEAFKAADVDKMESCLILKDDLSFDADTSEITGDQMEVVKALFSKTTYKLGQVNGPSSDNTASVSATVSCVDMSELLKHMIGEIFGAATMSAAVGEEVDEQAMIDLVMESLEEAIDDPDIKMTSVDITFELEKPGDEWLIVFDRKTSDDFVKALFGDLGEILLSIEADMT